uniref:Uncharacterized protein n=1 Tax=Xiphophorus couchianus TaxID=32473 RepID=A0A3B5MAH2_9TELE
MPREALEEIPETCCSRWKKREDFFDILADTLEGVLSCLDAVSSSVTGAKSVHAQVLSTALRNMDFIVTLVILKNACAPLRNCSTVFRCGNPADILCEVEKIPSIIATLEKMLKNVSSVHTTWFEQAFQLATKVAPEQVCFSEEVNSYDSPEIYYVENLSIPLLHNLIEEMKYCFSDNHLKALSVLSLLPSCNPQPILSETTDKPFSLYLADLPEPDMAEQEINKPADEEVKAPVMGMTQKVAEGPRTAVSFYEPQLREQILKELWDSQFFTVITEQVVEIDGELYIPLCIRYLKKEDIQCEETLAFIPFTEDSGVLSEAIETALSEKWGLNMEYCRGQASLSVGEAGAQMRAVSLAIATKYPQAIRTVSSALSLNVWLARSSPAEEAANGSVLVDKLLHWLTEDVERQNMLEDMIMLTFQQDEAKACELRDKLIKNWEKSHDMHEVMVEILEAAMLCLNELKGEGSTSDQQQASNFFDAIRNFEFIFSTVVLNNVLSLTKKLSQSLQGKPLDMLLAVNTLPDLKASLGKLKSEIDIHHKSWFDEAVSLASKLNIQMLHSVLLEPLSDFYKESVSMNVVEHSIAEIDDLFTDKVLDTLKCLEIVPYAMFKVKTSILSGIVYRLYKEDLPDQSSLHSEMKAWKEKWLDPLAGYLPATVLDTLKTSQIRSFSNIETLLRLQVILPFSRRESNFRQGKRSLTVLAFTDNCPCTLLNFSVGFHLSILCSVISFFSLCSLYNCISQWDQYDGKTQSPSDGSQCLCLDEKLTYPLS